MSSVLKLSGPLKVGSLASAPSNPQEGYIYFNTTSNTFEMYQGGSFRQVDATGLEAHLAADSNIKHTATQVDYQRSDGSRKNIAADATSPHVEAALSNLDDAIGALAPTPSNYTPASPAIVASHLAAIDTALGNINITPEFSDSQFRVVDNGDATKKMAFEVSAVATATTRTVTMPDANVNLGLIATAIQSSEKGAANGVAPLDSGSKIAAMYLPSYVDDVLEYANQAAFPGTGETGKIYIALDTNKTYRWSGSVYVEVSPSDVNSVNGQTGIVTLTTDNVSEGSTNKYFSAAAAQTAVVIDSIADADTTHAPSRNAVFDALALKLASVSQDTAPALGGNLEVGANTIEAAANPVLLAGQNAVRRAKQASKTSFVEEEYIHSIALAGSQSNTTISAFTFAFASFEGLEITYKFKQTSTSNVRIGTMRVVTNGTSVVLNDIYTDSADTAIAFSAVVNGSNIEIRYTSGTNGGTMRADVKKFLT